MTNLEQDKIHAETQKLLTGNRKLMSEQILIDKKVKWYELILMFGAGLAIATILSKM